MIWPLRCNQFCNGIWFDHGLPPTHFPCSVAWLSSVFTSIPAMHHENRSHNYMKIMQHLLLAFYLVGDVLAQPTNSNKMRKTKASWERYVQNVLRASPSRNENIKIHSIRSDGYGENHLTCSCSGSSTCYNWRSVSLEHLVTFYILFDRVSTLDSSWRFDVFFFFALFHVSMCIFAIVSTKISVFLCNGNVDGFVQRYRITVTFTERGARAITNTFGCEISNYTRFVIETKKKRRNRLRYETCSVGCSV